MKLSLLLLLLASQLTAQILKPIPDINLRKELARQGFILHDSLDMEKTQGRSRLELDNKDIENLDGLQYFSQLRDLTLYNNKIVRLDHLPPNLKTLVCAKNLISDIDDLPPSLTYLDLSNNLLKKLPPLPGSLQYLNYSNNQISLDSLFPPFNRTPCGEPGQNCIPNELMKWRLLNANIKDTSFDITKMIVQLNSRYGWGFGRKTETIEFKVKNLKLVAKKTKITRSYNQDFEPKKKNKSYTEKANYSVDIHQINQFIKDIYSKNLMVQLQIGDSNEIVNLKNKKNGVSCTTMCMDCGGYNIQYTFYGPSDTISLNYSFDEGIQSGPTICSGSGMQDVKSILEWLYIYKLVNMTVGKQELVQQFFNRAALNSVVKWAK